ncbi:MAG TPA: hypothetical protein VJH20_04110 [Candidatus Nanoarchaeia archaeon]|nr:hypothetical protein [Candidatus Nanoarchaeia archaeon]
MLLSRRNKYKCALCGKLWKQRFIEDSEFRRWNHKERLELKRQVSLEYKREYSKLYTLLHPRPKNIGIKLSTEEKQQKSREAQRKYYQLHKDIKRKSSSNWERQNKEYRNEYHRKLREKQLQQNPNYYKEQYMENREIKLTQQKVYYQIYRERILQKAKEKYKLKKALALEELQNSKDKAQEAQNRTPNAHFILSDLLNE